VVREEIRQRLQDIRHFEEEHKVLFEKDQRAGKSSIRDVTFSCIEQKETVELPAGHFVRAEELSSSPVMYWHPPVEMRNSPTQQPLSFGRSATTNVTFFVFF